MFRINNKGNDFKWRFYMCKTLKKQTLRENNFLKKKKKIENLVLDSSCLPSTKKQEKHLTTFANNHV